MGVLSSFILTNVWDVQATKKDRLLNFPELLDFLLERQ